MFFFSLILSFLNASCDECLNKDNLYFRDPYFSLDDKVFETSLVS